MTNSKEIVREGYNRISFQYRDDQGRGVDAKNMTPWMRWVEKRLKKGDSVLELGCGMGIPCAKYFSKNFSYLGVDISDIQIKRAKKLVPNGKFRRADMNVLRLSKSSFSAVLSFYSIIHLPLKEQRPLLRRVYQWLEPGGFFVAMLGHGRWTGREKDWHGTEMFWSHVDRQTYTQWLEGVGFKVVQHKPAKEGRVAHELFFCIKNLRDEKRI